jgi:DNA-binding NtrC family response regulator
MNNSSHVSPARARVLILDDDEDLALCLHEVLELRHHQVRVAHDLDTARDELATEAPDVFVADLFIGRLRSDDLIVAVHVTLPWVRCVLISGSDRHVWNHLIEDGVVHTALRKPFDTAEFIAIVEEADDHNGEDRADP